MLGSRQQHQKQRSSFPFFFTSTTSDGAVEAILIENSQEMGGIFKDKSAQSKYQINIEDQHSKIPSKRQFKTDRPNGNAWNLFCSKIRPSRSNRYSRGLSNDAAQAWILMGSSPAQPNNNISNDSSHDTRSTAVTTDSTFNSDSSCRSFGNFAFGKENNSANNKPAGHRGKMTVSVSQRTHPDVIKYVGATQRFTGQRSGARRNCAAVAPGTMGSSNSSDNLGPAGRLQQRQQQQAQNDSFRGRRYRNHNPTSSSRQSKTNKMSSNTLGGLWKTAADPKTGRTYYYHTVTRETQWHKPLELATDDEKKEMEEKDRQQKDFFAAMEANIMKSMQQGGMPSKPAPMPLREKSIKLERPRRLIKTISAMEETVLRDLIQRVPSHRSLKPDKSPAHPRAVFASGAQNSAGRSRLLPVREVANESVSDYMETPFQQARNEEAKQLSGNVDIVLSGVPADRSEKEIVWNGFPSPVKQTPGESGGDNMEIKWNGFPSSIDAPDLGNLPFEGEDSSPDFLQSLPIESPAAASLNFDELPLEELGDPGTPMSSTMMFLHEGVGSFGLTDEETEALQKLAEVTEEMTHIGDDISDELAGLPFENDKEEETEITPRTLEQSKPSLKNSSSKLKSLPRELEFDPDDETTVASEGAPKGTKVADAKPSILRRNTCGTLYVGSTLSQPDEDATIKCVCGVYRAHILHADIDERSMSTDSEIDTYCMFNDQVSHQRPVQDDAFLVSVPSLDEITNFYRDVFRRAQMEPDCIIITLVYVERLIKCTDGELRPRARNWRSLLFSCMVLASKVWDDMSMWNADFSQTCPAGVHFSLKRINELEVEVLSALKFKVKVPASEYAKYYFLLRCMLIKSGLSKDHLKSMTTPLDVQGAKRLQHMSSQFQLSTTSKEQLEQANILRSRSVGPTVGSAKKKDSGSKVGLEHVVRM